MNAIDFLRETAAFLVKDRPDVYDHETAVEELSVAMESLRETGDAPFTCLTFTSYMFARLVDDGVEEFILSRKLSSLLLFPEEEDCRVYSHTRHITTLPNILDADDDL